MPDLLTDFESYFTAGSLLTSWSLFKDTILDTPDDAIAIYEYSGSVGDIQIAGASRSIQIVTRSKVAVTAKAKANELYKSLRTDDGILDLTTTRWTVIDLKQPPFRMKVDNQARVYYCFNLSVSTYED